MTSKLGMLSLTGLTLCAKLVQIRLHSFLVKHCMQSGIHSIRVTVRQPVNTINDPLMLCNRWNFTKYIMLANHIKLITSHSEKVSCPFQMQPLNLILWQYGLKQEMHQWCIHGTVLYLAPFNALTTGWAIPISQRNRRQA